VDEARERLAEARQRAQQLRAFEHAIQEAPDGDAWAAAEAEGAGEPGGYSSPGGAERRDARHAAALALPRGDMEEMAAAHRRVPEAPARAAAAVPPRGRAWGAVRLTVGGVQHEVEAAEAERVRLAKLAREHSSESSGSEANGSKDDEPGSDRRRPARPVAASLASAAARVRERGGAGQQRRGGGSRGVGRADRGGGGGAAGGGDGQGGSPRAAGRRAQPCPGRRAPPRERSSPPPLASPTAPSA